MIKEEKTLYSLKGRTLKRVKSYFTLLFVFVIVFSLISAALSKDAPILSITFSGFIARSNPFVSSTIGNSLSLNSTLSQPTRNMIFSIIEANPGIHFRGICSILGISVGVAQYHLGILTKAGLIRSFRDGRFKRFFNSQEFSSWELQIISLLRKKTTGIILTSLLRKKSVSHKRLTQETGISSQALSWHIRRLKFLGILNTISDGIRNEYFLTPEKSEIIKECLELF